MHAPTQSVMPRAVRITVGVLTAILIAPFIAVVAIPILVVMPATFPFAFSAFLGDFRAEHEAYQEAVDKYRAWKLPPLFEPDHLAPAVTHRA